MVVPRADRHPGYWRRWTTNNIRANRRQVAVYGSLFSIHPLTFGPLHLAKECMQIQGLPAAHKYACIPQQQAGEVEM